MAKSKKYPIAGPSVIEQIETARGAKGLPEASVVAALLRHGGARRLLPSYEDVLSGRAAPWHPVFANYRQLGALLGLDPIPLERQAMAEIVAGPRNRWSPNATDTVVDR